MSALFCATLFVCVCVCVSVSVCVRVCVKEAEHLSRRISFLDLHLRARIVELKPRHQSFSVCVCVCVCVCFQSSESAGITRVCQQL